MGQWISFIYSIRIFYLQGHVKIGDHIFWENQSPSGKKDIESMMLLYFKIP